MDYITIRLAYNELAPLIKNAQVRDIVSQGEKAVAIIIWCGCEAPIVFSADAETSRFHLLKSTPSRGNNPDSHFHRQLRHHIAGASVDDISLVNNERIIEMKLIRREFSGELKEYRFIAELMGRFSNLILTESDGTIVISHRSQVPRDGRGREIRPGKLYTRPDMGERIPLDTYEFDDFQKFIRNDSSNKSWGKLFLRSFSGITPGFISVVSEISAVDENITTSELNDSQIDELFKGYNEALNRMKNNDMFPPFSELLTIDKKADYPVNRALADYYYNVMNQDHFEKRRNHWQRVIQGKIKSLERLLANLEKDLSKSENKDHYRKLGDLIYANIGLFKTGVREIEVDDIFDTESSAKIKLKLLEGKDASASAKEYHKRASKLARGEKEIQDRINITSKQIDDFKAIMEPPDYVYELDDKSFENVLGDIKSGKSKKYLKKGKTVDKSSELPKKLRDANIHHYRSPEGADIYVGGNDKANEALYRWGNPDDYWLHVKNIPGSHVLIPRRGDIIEFETIVFAARLAVFHSRVKGATKVPVDYTLLKYVKKPPGSDLGYVIYSKEKNVLADSLDERTEKKSKQNKNS